MNTLRLQRRTRFGLVILLLLMLSSIASARQYATIERVNISTAGAQSRNGQHPVISQDGRYVAFWSDANDLIPSDNNNTGDVFVRDRQTNETVRVSIGNGNVESNNATFNQIGISHNGVLVTFASDASNLVDGDNNNVTDVFVFDRGVGAMARVSVSSAGEAGDNASTNPIISGDGTKVVFRSAADNLVPGDTNEQPDLFLFDRTVQQIARVNISSANGQADAESATSTATMSDNGVFVAFDSIATNLVANDTNGVGDIFFRDRGALVTSRISVSTNGTQANGASWAPAMSGDSRYIAFTSDASNLVPDDTNGKADIFVHDRVTGETVRVSVASDGTQANGSSTSPSTNLNGRYITFWSDASNLVPGDNNNQPDIFVHDTVTGITTRVSVSNDFVEGNGASAQFHMISSDGNFITFESVSSNLVANDTNNSNDIFVARGGPSSPTNLTATVQSNTQVRLEWEDNSDNENNFIVQRRIGSNAWTDVATLAANIETYTDINLDNCTTYRYRVWASNAVGQSPSNTATARTLGCPPGDFILNEPFDESVVVNPFSLDKFTWSFSAEAETYDFTLDRTSGGVIGELFSEQVNADDICGEDQVCRYSVDETLQEQLTNGEYAWEVSATNGNGTTAASNNPYAFTVDTTATPRDFKLLSPENGALIRSAETLTKITWNENPDAASYDFYLFQISDNPLAARLGLLLELVELTPDSTDGDALGCADDVCTLTLTTTEQDLLDIGTFSWTVVANSPGGTQAEAVNGPFIFAVNTGAIEMLVNGGFEIDSDEDKVPDGWTRVNQTKDKLKCRKVKPDGTIKTFAYEGDCTFRFKGGPNEDSRLQQKPTGIPVSTGDVLNFSAYVEGKDVVAGARVKLVLKYDDSAPVRKTKEVVSIPLGTYDYTLIEGQITAEGEVTTVKVQFLNRMASGRFQTDAVSFVIGESESAPLRLPQTPDDLLPLPESPPAFRAGS